ncbi:MAG: hypothetical protein JWO82_2280, partial [Akkermansiaceae bacterium]|nr:hypothetical protein [Akkermansiaceae bacterium]
MALGRLEKRGIVDLRRPSINGILTSKTLRIWQLHGTGNMFNVRHAPSFLFLYPFDNVPHNN